MDAQAEHNAAIKDTTPAAAVDYHSIDEEHSEDIHPGDDDAEHLVAEHRTKETAAKKIQGAHRARSAKAP
jgi:hypothetical protein